MEPIQTLIDEATGMLFRPAFWLALFVLTIIDAANCWCMSRYNESLFMACHAFASLVFGSVQCFVYAMISKYGDAK